MPFTYQPFDSRLTASIGELMAHRGDPAAQAAIATAQAQARAAEASGRARASLGATIGNGIQDITQQIEQNRLLAPRRELEALQLNSAKQSAQDDLMLRHALSLVKDGDYAPALKFLDAQGPMGVAAKQHVTGLIQKDQAQHDEDAGQLGFEIFKGGGTPDAVKAAVDHAVKAGKLTAAEGQQFHLMSVEEPDRTMAAAQALMGRSENFRKFLTEPTKPHVLDVDPTHDVIDPATGKVIRPGTPKPIEPKIETRSLDVQAADALKRGDTTEYARLLKVKKEMGQADDRPRINVNVGPDGKASTLTDDAVEYAATEARILGLSKIPTRLDDVEKKKIINAVAAQTKILGQTPAQAIQKQFAMKADAGALNQIEKMASSAEAFETKANSQALIVEDLSQKVERTQYPILNKWLLAGKADIAGDADTQLLFNAITTFTTEYAKLMEGSTGSVAASTDSARKASERLIKASLNKDTLSKTLGLMQKEMGLTRHGYDVTRAHIIERMGGQPPAPTAAPPPPPPAGKRGDPLGLF